MKTILSIVTVMAVTLSACFISAFSSVLSAAEEVPFKSLYTFTLADTDLGYELRGLAASQDGEYLYAGFLQNTRNVLKIDAADGSIVDAYTPAIPEISLDIDRYPKGLATDDRGNLFVGITHAENGNNHMLTLAAVRQSDMTEISHITDTVAEAGTAIGVNGITVVKQGDRYLCYAAICYSNYSIRCYDVTDPENITLYSGFASDGVLSTGFSPYYLAADGMGNVYVTGVENSIYGVYKINASGEILAQATVNRAYGIVLKDTHILISSSGNDGTITLLDTGLNILGQYTVSGLSGNFVQSAIGGDTVYIADCGNGEEAGGIAGAVYAAPVSVMDGDKVNISALKADKTPEIDGSLADDVWKGGFVTYTDESYGKPLQFKFVWDDDNLYLAAKMIDVTPFCNTDKIFKDEAGAAGGVLGGHHAGQRHGGEVAREEQHHRDQVHQRHDPQHLLRAALHHHLLSRPGADGVRRPGLHRRAGDAAAGALLAVMSAGGLPGHGDLRVVRVQDPFHCCDLDHVISSPVSSGFSSGGASGSSGPSGSSGASSEIVTRSWYVPATPTSWPLTVTTAGTV